MVWKKVANNMKFISAAAGVERGYPLAVEDWGLRVKEVQVALLITDRSTANAMAGVRVLDGANAEVSWFATHSTPIAAATFGAMPLTARGFTPATLPIMPFFAPVVRAAGAAAAIEWFVADVYVGGKAY